MNQTTVDLVYRLPIQNSAKFFRHQYKILILPIILDIRFIHKSHIIQSTITTISAIFNKFIVEMETFIVAVLTTLTRIYNFVLQKSLNSDLDFNLFV